MSQYLAKKAELNTVRECNSCCSCFTTHGYFVDYVNGSISSVLFVCEDCFDTKYKSCCTIRSSEDSHSTKILPTEKSDSQFLQRLANRFNRSIKAVRITLSCILAICTVLTISLPIKNGTAEFTIPKTRDIQITSVISDKLDNIAEAFQYIFTRERNQDNG